MSPTHATKKGTRYRYYVSHALLQGRKREAGITPRVSASEIENAVLDAVRSRLAAAGRVTGKLSDGELIRSYVEHVTFHSDRILLEVHAEPEFDDAATSMNISFTPSSRPRKGIAYSPAGSDRMTDQTRDTLLAAIVRSRGWLEAITTERLSSFEQIAENEKLAERHVRFLAPLAFLSPRVVEAITEGRAPVDLNVSSLARKLSLSWKE
jgi:site-specific DNA recombinase